MYISVKARSRDRCDWKSGRDREIGIHETSERLMTRGACVTQTGERDRCAVYLWQDGQSAPQVVQADVGDVDAVDDDGAARGFNDAEQRQRQRRLARPRPTHYPHLDSHMVTDRMLTAMRRHVLEHLLC